MSRYAATTPTLLRWFDRYNAGRPYREHVRPFGFLLAFHGRPTSPRGDGRVVTGRSRRRGPVDELAAPRVVAPYDRDPVAAAARAFDRDTGAPVPTDRLATYRGALAQYHLHPEAKFANGDYLDRGPTQRRLVRLAGPLRYIGKEANRWEEQFYLGADPEAQIEYGGPADELASYRTAIAQRCADISVRVAADASGVSLGTVQAIRTGQRWPSRDQLVKVEQALNELAGK